MLNDDVFEYIDAIEELEKMPVPPPNITHVIKGVVIKREVDEE